MENGTEKIYPAVFKQESEKNMEEKIKEEVGGEPKKKEKWKGEKEGCQKEVRGFKF